MATGPTRARALVIESEEDQRAGVAYCVELAGCAVSAVERLDQALNLLDGGDFRLVVAGVSDDLPSLGLSALLAAATCPLILLVPGSRWLPPPPLRRRATVLSRSFVPEGLMEAVKQALAVHGPHHRQAETGALSLAELPAEMVFHGQPMPAWAAGEEVLVTAVLERTAVVHRLDDPTGVERWLERRGGVWIKPEEVGRHFHPRPVDVHRLRAGQAGRRGA